MGWLSLLVVEGDTLCICACVYCGEVCRIRGRSSLALRTCKQQLAGLFLFLFFLFSLLFPRWLTGLGWLAGWLTGKGESTKASVRKAKQHRQATNQWPMMLEPRESVTLS